MNKIENEQDEQSSIKLLTPGADDVFSDVNKSKRFKNKHALADFLSMSNFGCFVDIGIKENGLIHISKISNEFISDVNSKVHLSQQIEVTVIGIDTEKRKIQLSLID